MSWAVAAEIGLTVASSLLGGSDNSAARAQARAAALEAAQLERRAKQEEAEGGRAAVEIKRQGDVLNSDARAAMAASGGITDDAGSVDILGEIKGVVEHNRLSALFTARQTAEDTRQSAKLLLAGAAIAEREANQSENGLATMLSLASKVVPMAKEAGWFEKDKVVTLPTTTKPKTTLT